MQLSSYIRYLVLPLLLGGCASSDTVQDGVVPLQESGSSLATVLYILVPLLLLLGTVLYLCWRVLVHQRKSLLAAEVNLHQQEIRSASLVFQLREATRKYKELQERLNSLQLQNHKDPNGPARDAGGLPEDQG